MAAAYNLPFGGALFAMEVLLGTISIRFAVPALAASFLATWASWLLLPDQPTYQVLSSGSSLSLIAWAFLAGPLWANESKKQMLVDALGIVIGISRNMQRRRSTDGILSIMLDLCKCESAAVIHPALAEKVLAASLPPWALRASWMNWQLPKCFAPLRRLLEARLKKHGSREYVQVLRLLETFSIEEVTCAVEQALKLGTISFDAVRHLLLCRIERRPPRLDMENYPHLPLAQVRTTQAADYMTLLAEVCA